MLFRIFIHLFPLGWGRLQMGGNRTNVLMQASVPIKDNATCHRSYPGKLHDSMFCAGLDQGGIDTCQGDSGGPMVCEHSGRFYIEGVTSWGYGCAIPGLFGVYADVRYLRHWILQTMKTNWKDKRICQRIIKWLATQKSACLLLLVVLLFNVIIVGKWTWSVQLSP